MNPIGLILLIGTTLFPAYQLFSLPGVSDQVALFSQFLGLAALILMAWAQIWATRAPGVEAVFGGLDRVYVLHKWAGISAMAAILIHDTVDAEMRGLGVNTALNELAETVGEISLYGLLILIVISVATFIPYHLWKWTHKAMGGFFIAGAFHFFFINKPFDITDPAGLYTGAFCMVGMLAYLWTLLPETARPSHGYTVASLDQTGGALAIRLTPDSKRMRPAPGQFGIVRFTGAGQPEPHPFSFSHIDSDGDLRVTVKPLGDFTTRLERHVAPGQAVRVQGPFGHFRLSGKGREVWIAGGIGITPFLTWAQALDVGSGPVDLFYCVPSRQKAPHIDEVLALSDLKPNLRLHVIASDEGARLTPEAVAHIAGEDLSGVRVAFCGPVGLRRALQSGLRRYGVSARQFKYEEFELRTGVGLKRLAQWILDRRGMSETAQ